MKRRLLLLISLVAVSPTAFAQFVWENWSYPTSTTATASVGSGLVSLTLTGTSSTSLLTLPDPVQYQPNFPFTQTYGDSAGAVNFGTTSFQMQLNFSSFTSTAGLVLAIGQLAHVTGTSGYIMTAFTASNTSIPISSFGQFGNFDFGIPSNGGYLFNDDLSLTNNGHFHVATVAGQDDLNSDMLILSLPAGVSKILISLQTPSNPTGDTINFMVSQPVPEPSSSLLTLLGGVGAGFIGCWRQVRGEKEPSP